MANWLGERVDDFHDFTKKYDPLGHYAVEWPLKAADWSVKNTSGGLSRLANHFGVNSHLPDMVGQHAEENQNDFGQSAVRHVGSAAAIYGGMMGLGGEAGGSGAGGGAAGGAGEAAPSALGYGVEGQAGYTMPGTGSELNGLGMDSMGFNPSGYTSPGGNLDIPGGSTGKIPSNIQGMGGMNFGQMLGQGQKQGQYSGGRQNLPLMQNDKTDQQKLAELLTALQNQQQA